MPVRISDLLDGWEDGSTELPVPAGMSPERVREMTMEKIGQTRRPRRRMGLRLLACAGLAAAFTVSAMAAYQLWGPGELFDPFFTIERAPLDDGQKALLDEIGTTNLPPVTSGGTTLTPLAAIADEHTLYLRLRLEAPEGTALPDMGEQEGHIAHDIQLVDTGAAGLGLSEGPVPPRRHAGGQLPGAGVHAPGLPQGGQLDRRNLQDPDHHRPGASP